MNNKNNDDLLEKKLEREYLKLKLDIEHDVSQREHWSENRKHWAFQRFIWIAMGVLAVIGLFLNAFVQMQ